MIKWQIGVVPVQVSLAYRFTIAALVLAAYGAIMRRRLMISRADLAPVAAQGVLMFSLNYFFIYAGAAYITSGLIAVLFSIFVLFNTFNERVIYGTKIHAAGIVSGMLALTGIAMIFWQEIIQMSNSDSTIRGIALVLIGAYSASLGNMLAIRNNKRKVPIVAVNVWGMAIGAVASAIFALASAQPFIVDWQFSYVASLLFLAIPGTAIAFGIYLVVLDAIGATRASYISIMLPVVALLMSTLFEGYEWRPLAAAGLMLALLGNGIALTIKPKQVNTVRQSG